MPHAAASTGPSPLGRASPGRPPGPSPAGRPDPLRGRALPAPGTSCPRRPRRDLELHGTVQRRHLDVGAQRRLRVRDRQVDRQVVAAPAAGWRCVHARTGPRRRRRRRRLPLSLISAPSRTPAGIFTLSVRVRRSAPDPPHRVHGVSTIRRAGARGTRTGDRERSWFSAISPTPAGRTRRRGGPRLRAGAGASRAGRGPSIRTGTVVPVIASSNGITRVSRSAPRRAAPASGAGPPEQPAEQVGEVTRR